MESALSDLHTCAIVKLRHLKVATRFRHNSAKEVRQQPTSNGCRPILPEPSQRVAGSTTFREVDIERNHASFMPETINAVGVATLQPPHLARSEKCLAVDIVFQNVSHSLASPRL